MVIVTIIISLINYKFKLLETDNLFLWFSFMIPSLAKYVFQQPHDLNTSSLSRMRLCTDLVWEPAAS